MILEWPNRSVSNTQRARKTGTLRGPAPVEGAPLLFAFPMALNSKPPSCKGDASSLFAGDGDASGSWPAPFEVILGRRYAI